MLVNRVSIKRIEKLFQSLFPGVWKKVCAKKCIYEYGIVGYAVKALLLFRHLIIAVVAPVCVQHLSDLLLSPDRNKINYGRKNVYRLCIDISIHDQMPTVCLGFLGGKIVANKGMKMDN